MCSSQIIELSQLSQLFQLMYCQLCRSWDICEVYWAGWTTWMRRRGFCLSKSGFIARLCHLKNVSIKSWSSRNGVSDGSTKMWHPHVWGRSNDWPWWCSSNSRRGLCLKNASICSTWFNCVNWSLSINWVASAASVGFNIHQYTHTIYFQNLNLDMKT